MSGQITKRWSASNGGRADQAIGLVVGHAERVEEQDRVVTGSVELAVRDRGDLEVFDDPAALEREGAQGGELVRRSVRPVGQRPSRERRRQRQNQSASGAGRSS
jgi:hypothetical protein